VQHTSLPDRATLTKMKAFWHDRLNKLEWQNPNGSMKDRMAQDSGLKYLGTDVYRRP